MPASRAAWETGGGPPSGLTVGGGFSAVGAKEPANALQFDDKCVAFLMQNIFFLKRIDHADSRF